MLTKKTCAMFGWTCLTLMLLAVHAPAGTEARTGAEKVYHAIEINGVVCGYSEGSETPVRHEGRELVRQETVLFVMLSVLGSEFNSEIKVAALLDPKTRRVVKASIRIDQGVRKLTFDIEVTGTEAALGSSLRPEPKRIALTPGLLVGDAEKFAYLKKQFVVHQATEIDCDILEFMEEEIQRSAFRKIGQERINLAGRTFDALVVEQTNTKTGVKAKYWLAKDYDDYLQFEVHNRKVYLSDRKVVGRLKVANMDPSIFTKAGVVISDVQAITYMKLRVRIEPTGVFLAPADLNVPGQKFTGTVEKNVIDGVLEIDHPRYGGVNAPPFPFPPPVDDRLRRYLKPERFIESDDPVLVAQAREIVQGSPDCWQAAVRLSKWVAENIDYAIPGGGSARKTYDLRAGECGSHSMLLAALCRAVGIPARIVFGAMYTSNYGGGFGQHAWNEIYMGDAGWIPIDSTAFETDYVDSGHIRISELVSVASSNFNGKKIDVLEYKLAGTPVQGGTDFAPYLGKFANPQGGPTFTVLEKEGNLTLDVPGKMVLPFHRRDGQGRWFCKLASHLYLVFTQDETGQATEMALHQVITSQKKPATTAPPPDVSKELSPYLGDYFSASLNTQFSISAKDGRLSLVDSLHQKTIALLPPGADGGWRDEDGRNRYFFEQDSQGNVTTLKIDTVDRFLRGEQAAERVERTILAAGLAAGMKEYAELKKTSAPGVLFNEGSFNQLGYRLLEAGKLAEALAVFKRNAEEYPDSANVYDSLGEAHLKCGQPDLARENYSKSLRLNPKNEKARQVLAELTAEGTPDR